MVRLFFHVACILFSVVNVAVSGSKGALQSSQLFGYAVWSPLLPPLIQREFITVN